MTSEATESWTIGEATLTSVVEAETIGIPVEFFYPEATAKDVLAADWLYRGAAGEDGTIAFRVQSFVLNHRDKVIVVDPCVGNAKTRSLPFWNQLQLPWLERFVAAGFNPATVDMVVHTHLHSDHIGWDTQLIDGEWVPTFPNARHVYVGDELDWAADEDRFGQDPFSDSISPILDAGLAWEVSSNSDLGDGLSLMPTPGHTPGHASLVVDCGGAELVVTGDLLHHPFQLANPHLAETADWDAEMARQTRSAFFDQQSVSGSVQAGTHFPVSPVGYIESVPNGWQFSPVPGRPV